MFTGIVETTGKVVFLETKGTNLSIGIEVDFAGELSIGQSVAHNGVCLTIESIDPKKKSYEVTAVKETLSKTNLGSLKKGCLVNLERSLKVGDRIDGHFVQGHVDSTAEVLSVKKERGSWIFNFKVKSQKSKVNSRQNGASRLIIEKGSICINGVSLTVVETEPQTSNIKHQTLNFSVAIIPHTFSRTNFKSLKKGEPVNIEFDILAKHINKIISNR